MKSVDQVRIGLAWQSSPRLYEQVTTLLRSRLRAASIVVAVGVFLFLVREVILLALPQYEYSQRLESSGYVLTLALEFLVLAFAAFFVFLLGSSVPLSARALRLIEGSVFGVIAGLVGITQYVEVGNQVDLFNSGLAIAGIRGFMFLFFLLMVVYGLFIPNSWRQAARVVIPLALAPGLVNVLLALTYPGFVQVCGQAATFEQLSVSFILMFLGAVTVIYGAHVIYELRKKAAEAEEFGQYRLTEKIGSGGMGEVWRARHEMLARPAAIKLIKPEMLSDEADATPALIGRFEREARATALLKSPNTVDVYDFGVTDDGTLYYVMELLDGLDLETMVERFGSVRSSRAIFILQQVCESLFEAHESGLVHRDIKPANIFVCRFGLKDDFVKVLDFGLVKHREALSDSRLTEAGVVTGTPAFLAPELATDHGRADARSDIYSLGCVAYWLVTGFPLFESKTALGTILEHVNTPPIPPSERSEREVSPDLEKIILQCLEKAPEKRPQSAIDLKRMLESCEIGQPWNQIDAAGWWDKHMPRSLETIQL